MDDKSPGKRRRRSRKNEEFTTYKPVEQMQYQFNGAHQEDDDDLHFHQDNQDEIFTTNRSSINAPPHEQVVAVNTLELPPPELEEVYICDCCCISKQLVPSIRYMPTFRRIFYFFNYLVFASGLGALGTGLWFRIDPKIYEIHKYIETQNFTIAGWILLFGGFLACITSLVGFSAASRQAAGLLSFYLLIISIITVVFIGALVLLTVFGLGLSLERFLVKEIFEQMRRRAMGSGINSSHNEATRFLDFIQVKMSCCGAEDRNDYTRLGMVVPTTCYAIDQNYVQAPGCGRAIRYLLDIRAGLAVGFTVGSIIAQMATMILSALMFCSIYHWRAQARPATPVQS